MKKNIIFYDNIYDYEDGKETLVWIADKKYTITNETNDLIYCTNETKEVMAIEKDIKNMYYTI